MFNPVKTAAWCCICALWLQCQTRLPGPDTPAGISVGSGSAAVSAEMPPGADGSLDSLLNALYGPCRPLADTVFQWPEEPFWETREADGIWNSRFSHRAGGFSLSISETRSFDPGPRGIMREESERTVLTLNGREFRLGDLVYRHSSDTVEDVWDFSRGWRKFTLNGNRYFLTTQSVPGCTGSFCMWECTALVDVNGSRPEISFFESQAGHSVLTDIDCDGNPEWIHTALGPDEHPNHADTIHLYLRPYERVAGKGFLPMQDAKRDHYFAEILMVNSIFEPRRARILRKNWPN